MIKNKCIIFVFLFLYQTTLWALAPWKESGQVSGEMVLLWSDSENRRSLVKKNNTKDKMFQVLSPLNRGGRRFSSNGDVDFSVIPDKQFNLYFPLLPVEMGNGRILIEKEKITQSILSKNFDKFLLDMNLVWHPGNKKFNKVRANKPTDMKNAKNINRICRVIRCMTFFSKDKNINLKINQLLKLNRIYPKLGEEYDTAREIIETAENIFPNVWHSPHFDKNFLNLAIENFLGLEVENFLDKHQALRNKKSSKEEWKNEIVHFEQNTRFVEGVDVYSLKILDSFKSLHLLFSSETQQVESKEDTKYLVKKSQVEQFLELYHFTKEEKEELYFFLWDLKIFFNKKDSQRKHVPSFFLVYIFEKYFSKIFFPEFYKENIFNLDENERLRRYHWRFNQVFTRIVENPEFYFPEISEFSQESKFKSQGVSSFAVNFSA